MTYRNPTAVVRRTVARELQIAALRGSIDDAATLRGDLAADSLDMIAIAAAIEDDLDIAIDDEELASIVTVADLIRVSEAKAA